MTSGYVTQGKIVRSVSITGTYEVLARSGKRFVQGIAVNETTSSLYGVHTSITYTPGTQVVIFVPEQAETGSRLCFILGASNDTPIITKKDKESPFSVLSVLENALNWILNRSDTSLSLVPKDTILENNYSYGKAADILPGEWAKTTYLGGGFFLNDFLASFSISERTKIEAFFFKDLIRLTSLNYQERVGTSEREAFLEGCLGNVVTRFGATMQESLGGLDNDPFVPKDPTKSSPYNYELLYEHPFYNYQRVDGDLAQGILETYSLPPKNIDEDRPPGVLSIYKGYDGTYGVKAAREISFEKTSLIPVPWVITEEIGGVTPAEREPVEPVPYFGNADMTQEDMGFFGAEAVRQLNDHNLEKDSFNKFRVRDKIWSIPADKDEVLSDLNKIGVGFSDDPVLEKLNITVPYYSEPPASALIKPNIDDDGVRVADPNAKIYDVTSYIKQLPDGSIIISGGYGEEIRMYRGNIYMTCPGDIIKMPGRDHVMWAGGNNIQKANKGTTEIESETTSLITNGNMQLVSGASGFGTMIVENKSLLDKMDMAAYKEDMLKNESNSGGILFKSNVVATVANGIYLQGDNEFDSHISISAGKFNTMVRDAITYIQGGRFLVAGTRTMFEQNSTNVNIVSARVGLNTDQVKCHGGRVNIPYRAFGEKTDKVIPVSAGQPRLVVQGAMEGRSLRTGTVSAISLGENPAALNGFDAQFASGLPGATAASSVEMSESLFSKTVNEELAKWGIVLPKTRYAKFSVPVSRWQNMLKSGNTWTPVEINDSFTDTPVMSYPGKENMEVKGGLKKLENEGKIKDKKLSEDLVINSQ